MSEHARFTRVLSHGGKVLAADMQGRVHILDRKLQVLRSSQAGHGWGPPNAAPIYALAADDNAIYGRDKAGNLMRWRRADLALTHCLDATATCDPSYLLPGEEPGPTMVRGFGIWGGKGYVSNGYCQLVVLDLASFAVEDIRRWPFGDVRLESFDTSRPGLQAVSDREGHVYLGDLQSLSFTPVTVDSGNVHRVRWDRVHDRYWATTDAGLREVRHRANGVVVLTPSGAVVHQSQWARNDVEALEFSKDGLRVYVGGFDNALVIYDNIDVEPRILTTVTGFSHQIIDLTVAEDGRVYVLSQDGEVVCLDQHGTLLGRLGYQRQCIWDLQLCPDDPRRLVAATDDGVTELEVISASGDHGLPSIRLFASKSTGLGFTRRIALGGAGSWGVAWDRSVFHLDVDGQLQWCVALPTIAHTLTLSPDESTLLVTTTVGAIELSASSGVELGRCCEDGTPTWAGAYTAGGDRIVGTRSGGLTRLGGNGAVVWDSGVGNYSKRIAADADRLIVMGGGGVKIVDALTGVVLSRFTELLDNTVENAVRVDGLLCAVSYGMQLAAYDEQTGELLCLFEDLPDFPKGMAVVPTDTGSLVVVGGRGGYLRMYVVDRSDPDAAPLHCVSTTWLPGSACIDEPRVDTVVADQIRRFAAQAVVAAPA